MFDYSMNYQIQKIRILGSVPQSNPNFPDARIATLLSDELISTVVPFIMAKRQEYFVTYTEYDIDATSVPAEFDMPYDAVYMKIRDLTLVIDTGTSKSEISLPELSLETVSATFNNYVNNLFGFCIRDNTILLYPGAFLGQSYKLRLYYYRRPLELALTTQSGKISAINGNNLTMTYIPVAWQNGSTLNAVSPNPSFKTIGPCTITSIANPVITVDDASAFSVGDWLALEGYSPIPQIPVEAMPFLQQCCVLRIHESMGDQAAMKIAMTKKQELAQILEEALQPRVDGARQVIQNRYSIMRRRW